MGGRVDSNIDDIYFRLCRDLLKAPKVANTRELNNVKIELRDINRNITSIRGISPSYLFGELLWYFNGDNSLKFIEQYSKFWKKLSDDGVTCNSAYGHLMQTAHGFNQIEKVINLLKLDPNSRRAKININTPNDKVDTTRDEPCTMSLHFMIRKGNLDCTAIMRSNDIWIGFPYDVAFFTTLQKYIARRLGVGYGFYTHFAVSLHLYDRDEEKIAAIVDNPISKHIRFDEEKFFENFQYAYDVVNTMRQHDRDVKTGTVQLFKDLGIYKEGLCGR